MRFTEPTRWPSRLPDGGAQSRGAVARVLPEQVLVRRSVGQGIGRAVRDVYSHQRYELLPDHMRDLLVRLETTRALSCRSHSTKSCAPGESMRVRHGARR